jgi:peptide/nickel transport system substrate-binding protein
MLASRQADHSEPWIPEDILNDLANTQGVKVPSVGDITRPIFLMCNNKNDFLKNVHLRRALSYCFDYDTCLTRIYGSAISGHERLYSPVAKGFTGWIIPKNYYTYDPAKAKTEFDLSGFKPGEVSLDFLFPMGEEPRRETGLLLKDNASAIGVTVNVIERDWATCMEIVGDPTRFNGYLCVVPAFVSNDPDLMLYTFYHSESWKSMGGKATYSNCTYLDNPDVDKMIMDARYETDESKRLGIYADLQNWLVDNAVDMWTVQQKYREPMLDDIQGWYYPPMSFPALGSPGNQYYGLWRERL